MKKEKEQKSFEVQNVEKNYPELSFGEKEDLGYYQFHSFEDNKEFVGKFIKCLNKDDENYPEISGILFEDLNGLKTILPENYITMNYFINNGLQNYYYKIIKTGEKEIKGGKTVSIFDIYKAKQS